MKFDLTIGLIVIVWIVIGVVLGIGVGREVEQNKILKSCERSNVFLDSGVMMVCKVERNDQ